MEIGHAFSINALRSLERLSELAAESAERPRLVFAHVLLPHPALLIDQNCRIRPEQAMKGLNIWRPGIQLDALEERRAAYVEHVECVNDHLTKFVEAVPGNSLALLTADHTRTLSASSICPLDQWTDLQLKERFAVLSAYRLTGSCETVPERLGLVNSFRLLLGCGFDLELPLL